MSYEVKNINEDLIWGKNDIGYRTREMEKILTLSAHDKTERQEWERKERVRKEARFRQLHRTVLS